MGIVNSYTKPIEKLNFQLEFNNELNSRFEYFMKITGEIYFWKNDNELIELCKKYKLQNIINYTNISKKRFMYKPENSNYGILYHNIYRYKLLLILIEYILQEYITNINTKQKLSSDISVLLKYYKLYFKFSDDISEIKYSNNISQTDIFSYLLFYSQILELLGAYFIILIDKNDYEIICNTKITSEIVNNEIDDQILTVKEYEYECPKKHKICNTDKNRRFPYYECLECSKKTRYIMHKNWFDRYLDLIENDKKSKYYACCCN